MNENSYGVLKRISFFANLIQSSNIKTVLDVGCGTGFGLTIPLAKKFTDVHFLGVEPDSASLKAAVASGEVANVKFQSQLPKDTKFDLIIASEVIEHVADPLSFLKNITSLLNKHGYLGITVPNGYGPFELMDGLRALLKMLGRRVGLSSKNITTTLHNESETLAQSPHVQFFKYGDLLDLFSALGLDIVQYKGRTALCGFLLSPAIDSSPLLVRFNSTVADNLPPALVSDWMFICRLTDSNRLVRGSAKESRLRSYAIVKRWLNNT